MESGCSSRKATESSSTDHADRFCIVPVCTFGEGRKAGGPTAARSVKTKPEKKKS